MANEQFEQIAEKVFGEGNDLVKIISWMHKGSDKKYWDGWEEQLEEYRQQEKERPESKNAKEDRLDEENRVKLARASYAHYKALLPFELERLTDHPFHRLTTEEKLIFLQRMVDHDDFPICIRPQYNDKSLAKGGIQYWDAYKGGVVRWLQNKSRWSHLPFDEEKIKKDSDLIQIATLFDFVPEKISPEFVSQGIIWNNINSNRGCNSGRHNAYLTLATYEGYGHDIRTTHEFVISYLINFDRILRVQGLTDYTVLKTKESLRKQK